MKLSVLALLVAFQLRAGTIDVSSLESITLRTGESITFDLFTSSYGVNARSLGLPSAPDTLQLALVTTPTASHSQFAATLSSERASTTVTLDSLLAFTPGYEFSAGYQGAVSTLKSEFHFDPQVTQDLFSTELLRLRLTNLGDEASLGVPSQTLSHDLYASLSGGPLSVGVTIGPVTLETLQLLRSARAFSVTIPTVPTVPEPASGPISAVAGALLCASSAAVSRRARRSR